MKRTLSNWLLSIFFYALIIGSCFAQNKPPIEEYPYPGYKDLAAKAVWLQEDLHQNNMQYGIVMPRVLLPPEGNDDLSSAHQEDGGNRTGPYLATLSFQYAVTGDKKVKQWAN